MAQIQHPDITEDMRNHIDELIRAHQKTPGAVIPVLRQAQDIVGYLPVELIDYIAIGLNLPKSDVLGVASFYALFSLTPKGRHTIRVCLGTACYVKGAKEVLGRITQNYGIEPGGTTEDRRFSLEGVRCLGACGLAPVIVVDQDTHGSVKPDAILDILEQYP